MSTPAPPRPVAHRDNLLGVCHAIGTTFGFDPLWLRVIMIVGVLIDFETTLIVYAAGAVAVLIARLLTNRMAPAAPRSA